MWSKALRPRCAISPAGRASEWEPSTATFPNRDSLLEALLRSRFAALTARAESLLLAADPAAALLEWLAESVAFTHQHRGSSPR